MKSKYTLTIFTVIFLLFSVGKIKSQNVWEDRMEVHDASVNKIGDKVAVSMEISFDGLNMRNTERYVFTPMIVKGSKSETFPKIEIAGRRQRIYQERNTQYDNKAYYTRLTYKKGTTKRVSYNVTVPYEKWMEGSSFVIQEDACGCSNMVLDTNIGEISKLKFLPDPFNIHLAYIQPNATPKYAEINGTAYLIFRAGKTDIDPALVNNATELANIHLQALEIDSEEFATIKKIRLHGFASPEGSYALNTRLAQQRVDAVKTYLQTKYGYSASDIKTSSTPENWVGLRQLVEESSLHNKSEILGLIDRNMDSDEKEKEIKRAYPVDYDYVLKNFYPRLRRTDYVIDYTIRSFTVEEAKQLLKSRPSLLSLNEMYLVAQEYSPGSDAFNEVFDTAVKLFPDDEIANLNAANVALSKHDLKLADKYLQKAGDSPQAVTARGVLAMLNEDFTGAVELLKNAKNSGISEADENLKQVLKRLETE